MPHDEAAKIARSHWRRFFRYRLVRLVICLVCFGGISIWALGAYWDIGFAPPLATSHLNADLGPDNWGQVRRTPQNTGYTPSRAPVPRHVKWTYKTSQPLYASPAVAPPYVYLTTMDREFVALDERTGEPVWTYSTLSPSSSTPIVVDQRVILALRTGLVISLNRDTHTLQWQTTLNGSILASPILVNGTLYIGTSNSKLYALDAATGQPRWVYPTEAWVVAAVTHAADRVIVTTQTSHLSVVGSETGRRRLLFETGIGRQIMSSVAIQGKHAYFGDRRGRVWAINWQSTTYPLERGLLYWRTNLFIWGFLSTPPMQKGTVWSRRIGGPIALSPAIAHDMVYIASSRGEMAALDVSSGDKRWHIALNRDVTSAPTVADTTVLVGTKTGVVGIHAHTGERQWSFTTTAKINASPIVAGETIYAVSHDGKLYAISGKTTP